MRARLLLLSTLTLVLVSGCAPVGRAAGPVRSGVAAPPSANGSRHLSSRAGKMVTVRAVVRLNPQATDSIDGESFVDPSHGWVVVGDRIMATADGGRSWKTVSTVDGAVYNIGFVSAHRGWLFTGDRLGVTVDGGKTWRWEEVPRVAGITPREAQFVDEEHGWILGTGRAAPVTGRAKPGTGKTVPVVVLWSTDDGGRTWSRLDVPAKIADRESGGSCYFSFISPEQGWLLLGTQPGTGQQGKSLYRTTDGGRNWSEVASVGFYAKSQPKNGLPGFGDITGLYFVNAQAGWITEDRGLVCRTTDGGRSWRLLGSNRDTGFDFPDFLDADRGWVVSGNALMVTRDAGGTWSQVFPRLWPWPSSPVSVFSGFKLCFGSGGDGVAVGTASDSQAVLATQDGGFTWRETGAVPDKDGAVIDFSFPDLQHGWAVTENLRGGGGSPARIYRTGDGGRTWEPVPATAGVNPYGVSFVDDHAGFVTGRKGRLWVTHDGGRTLAVVDAKEARAPRCRFVSAKKGWKLQNHRLYATADGGRTWRRVRVGRPVIAFDPLGARSAWVIAASFSGYNPELLATTDGGESWTAYDLGDVKPAGVAFVDLRHGWVVDDQGNRYHTADGGRTWTEVDPFAQ